jgi:hypothetical protein
MANPYRWIIQVLQASSPFAWGTMIALLPITSLPVLIALVHSDMVGSASAIPLLWLFFFWFLPYLARGGSLPRATLPLIGFVLVALASSAGAYFLDLPAYKGLTLLSREVRALFTLGVGLSFYLVASAWPDSLGKLRFTLRILNYSGVVIILWSALQFYLWYKTGGYPAWLNSFQAEFINMRGFFADRATGLTLEPSWLAHQLNLLYLPFWLSATITRQSAHRFRFLGLIFEDFLLAGGVATLVMSQSRVGIVAFFLVIAFLAVRANVQLAQWIHKKIAVRIPFIRKPVFRWSLTGLILVAFAMIYLVSLVGVTRAWAKYDRRVARLFETPTGNILSIEYTNQLGFAERVVFWAVGWEVFPDYPILGVGLGNTGFYFPEKMPAFGWALPEINRLMYYVNHIPNTKSLWSRILSETGLTGLAFFLSWLTVLWYAASYLRHHPDRSMRSMGLAGGMVLVALLLEGFSVDTFALPYWWISLGLISAASRLKLDKAGIQAAPLPLGADALETNRSD